MGHPNIWLLVVGTFAGTVDTIGARNRVGKLPAGNNRKGMVVVAIDHWMPAEMIFSGTSRLAGTPGSRSIDATMTKSTF